MRKLNVLEFVSLDGVIQSPDESEEDTLGSLKRGTYFTSSWA
jgi:hypothetical protein